MHNQRITGQLFLNLLYYVDGELWCGLKLISTVAGPYGYCQGIATGLFDELDDLIGIGQMLVYILSRNADNIFLDTTELTKLCFYDNTAGMSVVNDLLGDLDVLLERCVRCVDHDRSESVIDTLLARLESVAVIQMHTYRYVRILLNCNVNYRF